jgi:hypothetical protein
MWWTPNDTKVETPVGCVTPCLFNATAGPGERVDVSAKNPGIVQALTKQWASYHDIHDKYGYNRSLYELMPNVDTHGMAGCRITPVWVFWT